MRGARELVLERFGDQTRLAVLEDGKLCEIYIERGKRGKLAGNIYAGRVQNVLPGMNAAFVDIGLSKNGFLYAGDIGMDLRGERELQAALQKNRIEDMLRPGQMIVVQVVKEAGGGKGPRVSGHLSLPGRLTVLLPSLKYAGVSRKIEEGPERDRLFEIAQKLSAESGAGVIVRTAGEGAEEAALRADYERLLLDWKRISAESAHSARPRLIQPDGDLALRAVRDMLDEDVSRVRTDDAALYERLRECAHALAPAFEGRIERFAGDTPLFDLLRVDRQLESAFERRVYLKSGGTLVIDETEAMTVVDVNTAKFTGKRSLEETVFKLNCEAAVEIARQLRLRDLGGIIIIDFIDMESPEAREALLNVLREALRGDRNRTSVLGMTQLGLVEMTRKKVRRPLSRQLTRDCPECDGAGRIWTAESVAYRAAREIWRRRRGGDESDYVLETGPQTAQWLEKMGPMAGVELRTAGDDRAFSLIPRGIEEDA